MVDPMTTRIIVCFVAIYIFFAVFKAFLVRFLVRFFKNLTRHQKPFLMGSIKLNIVKFIATQSSFPNMLFRIIGTLSVNRIIIWNVLFSINEITRPNAVFMPFIEINS